MCDASWAALRRLARNWGLVGLLGGACVCTAHASAATAPGPALFRLSLTGTASQDWSYTAAPDVNGGCTRTQTSEGIRRVKFRTKRSTIVRLVAGRVAPVQVRALAGTVTLAGANTLDERCGDLGTSRIADCVQTSRSFTGARLRISSPRVGLVALGVVHNLRLPRSDCPLEPVGVARRPLGPQLRPLRLPPEALTRSRVTRMTIRASRSGGTRFTTPEAGALRERAQWTLTFVRLNP